MNYDDGYEERGFFRKYGFALGIGGVVMVIGVLLVGQVINGKKGAPPPRMQTVIMIKTLPPPPPPPPPPKVEPPKEVVEKMVEQTPVDQPEQKPDDQPKDAPALTTNVTGPGNDGFGLGAGHGGGGPGGGGGRPSSRFGWYAGEVQKTISVALQRNRITSQAQFTATARVWADLHGRVTRVKLEASTADTAMNQAITDELTGLQLDEPPPRDMPMPIVMRLRARRPA